MTIVALFNITCSFVSRTQCLVPPPTREGGYQRHQRENRDGAHRIPILRIQTSDQSPPGQGRNQQP